MQSAKKALQISTLDFQKWGGDKLRSLHRVRVAASISKVSGPGFASEARWREFQLRSNYQKRDNSKVGGTEGVKTRLMIRTRFVRQSVTPRG